MATSRLQRRTQPWRTHSEKKQTPSVAGMKQVAGSHFEPKGALFYGISALSLVCLVGACCFACCRRDSDSEGYDRHRYPMRHAAEHGLRMGWREL